MGKLGDVPEAEEDANYADRCQVYVHLTQWIREGKIAKPKNCRGDFSHLGHILGMASPDEFAARRNKPEVTSVIRALAGPHAWSIYKMLMIRKRAKHLK